MMSEDNIFYFNSDQTLNATWNGAKLIFNPPEDVFIHIPLSIVEELPNNWTCTIYRDEGKGNVGFDYDGGIYLKSRFTNPETAGRGSVMRLEKIGTHTLWVSGDIQNA